MGYDTQFRGQFNLDKPLKPEHLAYLRKFNETRRMKRDADKALVLLDTIRIDAELPVGEDGQYFVGGRGFAGQDDDKSVLNHNAPPEGQPGLWCKWEPNKNGTAIEWDGAEKFYDYIQWIEYLIEHFLKPWGYKLNGKVNWNGENVGDLGTIKIKNNVVTVVSR
jgi:hypothetical protein